MFGIINKKTKEFFGGFNKDNSPKWVKTRAEAWSGNHLTAKCQAAFLVDFGAQRKPVSL